jgi:predicted metal-dependent hydrolase
LLAWLKHQALEAFRPRVAHYAAQLGLEPPRVTLSNAALNGASAPRTARSTLLAARAPRAALTDYVIAHEVAHLVEMNHSAPLLGTARAPVSEWRSARERLELSAARSPSERTTMRLLHTMLRVGNLQAR